MASEHKLTVCIFCLFIRIFNELFKYYYFLFQPLRLYTHFKRNIYIPTKLFFLINYFIGLLIILCNCLKYDFII